MSQLAASILVLASFMADGTRVNPGPVRVFGGKARDRGAVFVLDVTGQTDRIIAIDKGSGTANELRLEKTGKTLVPYGLARPKDGTLWILGDKGREVSRFDETTGKFIETRALPGACQGMWGFESLVVFSPAQFRGGEALFAIEDHGVFRPFTRLLARRESGAAMTAVSNLVACGTSDGGSLPCWWLEGAPEIMMIGRDEKVEFLKAPSMIGGPRVSGDPSYPIRDVFLLSRTSFWTLTNQEGASIFSSDSPRARHLIRTSPGLPPRVINLKKMGRAILDANERTVLLLYEDGTFERLSAP